jgi:hypothetical protein
MLSQVIRSDANRARDWDTARRSDGEERSRDRARIAKLELRLGSNGAR